VTGPAVRRIGFFLASALFLAASGADAKLVRKRQDKPRAPLTVRVDETADPGETLEEVRRRAGKRPVRIVPSANSRIRSPPP